MLKNNKGALPSAGETHLNASYQSYRDKAIDKTELFDTRSHTYDQGFGSLKKPDTLLGDESDIRRPNPQDFLPWPAVPNRRDQLQLDEDM